MQPPRELEDIRRQLCDRYKPSVPDELGHLLEEPKCWQTTDSELHRFFDTVQNAEAAAALAPSCLLAMFQNGSTTAGERLTEWLPKIEQPLYRDGLLQSFNTAAHSVFDAAATKEYEITQAEYRKSGHVYFIAGAVSTEIWAFIRSGNLLNPLGRLITTFSKGTDEKERCWFLRLRKECDDEYSMLNQLDHVRTIGKIVWVSGNVIDPGKINAIERISSILYNDENVSRNVSALRGKSGFADKVLAKFGY